MKTSSLFTAALVLAATAGTALAHSNEYRFKQQNQAIEYGRRTGELTWREGKKLRREQNAIVARKFDLESDGWLSKRDRRELSHMQNSAGSRIARESHDGWRRPWWLPRIAR